MWNKGVEKDGASKHGWDFGLANYFSGDGIKLWLSNKLSVLKRMSYLLVKTLIYLPWIWLYVNFWIEDNCAPRWVIWYYSINNASFSCLLSFSFDFMALTCYEHSCTSSLLMLSVYIFYFLLMVWFSFTRHWRMQREKGLPVLWL